VEITGGSFSAQLKVTMKIKSVLTNIDRTYNQLTKDDIWAEDPVSLKEFTESKYQLYFPLFPRQYKALQALVGDDPKLMFTDRTDYYSMRVKIPWLQSLIVIVFTNYYV
jgi:hypothetical protein